MPVLTSPQHGRRDYQWEKLASTFKSFCRTRNLLCHICVSRGDVEHAEIDYAARPLSPRAFEADHIKPWSAYPQLRYMWNNLAPAHSRCNRQRRDDELKPTVPEREWVKPDW